MTRILIAPALLLLDSAGSQAGVVSDALYASNFEAPPDCSSIGLAGCPGFSLEIPVVLAAGEMAAYCYYFRTPNSGALGVGRFSSRFDPVTAHIIAWTTVDNGGQPADAYPPGTLQACGDGSGGNGTTTRRIYQAHGSPEQLRMPDDDGGGTPVALELPANAAGFLQMYFVNPSLSPVLARVTFAANGLAPGVTYTKTATYATYNATFSIPPSSSGTAGPLSCSVPSGAKFWWFSTHTHHFATNATLSDGATTLVSTSDWQHPAVLTYAAPPFYAFGAGQQLTYACAYDNSSFGFLTSGDSYANAENCVGIGYFFPAAAPLLCLNSGPPF